MRLDLASDVRIGTVAVDKVYVGTTSGVYTTTIDVGNVTTYTVTGLQPGRTYYFVVSAYDLTASLK